MPDTHSDVERGRPLRVGLYGLGISNRGVLAWLRGQSQPFSLTVRADGALPATLTHGLPPGTRLCTGAQACKPPYEDILFLSPSIRRDRSSLRRMAAAGVSLCTDAELFFHGVACGALSATPYRGDIIAVTGSDGKSTVCALCAAMLREDTASAGNCGTPLAPLLLAPPPRTVVELSSFQLMQLHPTVHRAAILNLSENHLDFHTSYAEYQAAKASLLPGAEQTVFDADCEALFPLIAATRPYALLSSYDDPPLRPLCAPRHWLTLREGWVHLDGARLYDLTPSPLTAAWQQRDLALAIALTLELAERERVCEVIRSFRGLPHRLQTVAIRRGIRFLDSSIDTTPARTVATLRSTSGRTAVILCGRGKHLSYQPLIAPLLQHTCGAVLMGEIASELDALLPAEYPHPVARDMEEAVILAAAMPQVNTVLLSPSATSFDRYPHYAARGDDFAACARRLSLL